MAIQLNSPGWRIRPARVARGRAGGGGDDLAGLPREFLTADTSVADEIILEPTAAPRGREAGPAPLDLSYDLEPGRSAVLALRHPSGALTFHPPIQTTVRGPRSASRVQFRVVLRQPVTRGVVGSAIKAIVVKVGRIAADSVMRLVLPKAVEALERTIWKARGLEEGWRKVTKSGLAAGTLGAGRPVSPARSLLFIHGTFSNAAAAYRDLAQSSFFDRIADVYGDRIFAFDHFTLSRTPEENARMLLRGLPEQTTMFDVVTHSRGGLVLRQLVERSAQFGDLASRFKLGNAVLVAAPNDGTPLVTPKRWDDTVGWIANLLELFPDNPFTTGPAFVANGLVWLAHHAAVDLPGLAAMDGEGHAIRTLQGPPGPPAGANYSALVANFESGQPLRERLLDMGLDRFFGSANDLVVPSEGGWRIGRSRMPFIPASRIGCYGPGGNLDGDAVTHLGFFSRPATVDFLVAALDGRPHPMNGVDPRKSLPDRRLLRGATAPAMDERATPRETAAAEAPAPGRRAASRPARLRITVVNADLRFVREPLFIGHYRATRLTGTEHVVDGLVGGALGRSLDLGLYPVPVGSHQIFINTHPDYTRSVAPSPPAVIVVGLGPEGGLQAADLVQTVRQAVIAWAQRLGESKGSVPEWFELAATLIGSGGSGVTAGESARLVAQGVYEANQLLAGEHDGARRWPRASQLRIVELYLDRATEAWRALQLQGDATPGRYEVADAVQAGAGALQRTPDPGYRGAEYDLISVATATGETDEPLMVYSLDTRRARSEVRGQCAQSRLLRELVATASNDRSLDSQIGRTLFDLLIPIELEAYLAGSGEMQIELDARTAGIPWELLDTTRDCPSDEPPWGIRVKLLRKLRVADFRERVIDADADASALIIGEPACPQEYPRLLGARTEALAVHACLTAPGELDPTLVKGLFSDDPSRTGPDARTVINTLFKRPWRILHIAGHGALPQGGTQGGVVLSNGSLLGPSEVRSLRVVPELVSVNCCHLAGGDPAQLLDPSTGPLLDRATFASGIARALVDIGVRCVIAAGWAVDDDAARVFAERFYGALLQGQRFIDAVAVAREAAYRSSPSNTWGAYQCYGDPDWVLRRRSHDADSVDGSARRGASRVGSIVALKLVLERIIVQTKFQEADPTSQLIELQDLETRFTGTWGQDGSVAELFGEAFVEVGAVEKGMRWYERAVSASNGRASMRAVEQLANARGRLAWERVEAAARARDEIAAGVADRRSTPRARAAARRALADADRTLHRAASEGRTLIRRSLDLLKTLESITSTEERESLVGSANKRLALIESAVGRRARVDLCLRRMRHAYERALHLGRRRGASDVFYPAANCLVADVALNGGRGGWRGFDRTVLAIVRESLEAKSRHDADFWSLVGEIDLEQWTAIARGRLAAALPSIAGECEDLHKRVQAARMWASVYDTACLVLTSYAARSRGREEAAARDLLLRLRSYAQPRH